MAYQVLARKWRPKSFSTLKGQEHITRALSNALNRGQIHHAYLFTGTRGVGKTTIARILAKALNCEQGITPTPCGLCRACTDIDAGKFVDLIEVDAASRTRVEDTRELLENVQYAPLQGRFKIYLIDEVHMLSGHSFNAFLKTLEEPPQHVIFIMATTDPERIPITILSRCLRLILRPISTQEIAAQLQDILQTEAIPFENGVCEIIAGLADGSMRDALSLLEQAIAYCNNMLKTEEVQEMLGLSYQRLFPNLLAAIGSQSLQEGLKIIQKMANEGANFERVLGSLLQALHAVAIAQAISEEGDSELASFAMVSQETLLLKDKLTPEEVQLLYQIGLMGQRDLRFAPDNRTGFEMIFLRMLVFRPTSSVASIDVSNHANSNTTPLPSYKEDEKKIDSPIKIVENQKIESQPEILDWSWLITQLSLSGFSRALVKHCIVSKWDGERLLLTLEESQKTCLNPQREQQIQEAISLHFKRPIKVSVQIGPIVNQTTPAQQTEILANERQNSAQKAVEQDETVQKIISTFDATVEKIIAE